MKLVKGVGYNSGGLHSIKEDGKASRSYRLWLCILQRCYSDEYQNRNPTYIGCTVCEEWLDFQVFAEWCKGNKYHLSGYDLDKDLLVKGNKIYSPETCVFVPQHINTLLNSCASSRGKHPRGIYFNKPRGKYLARFSAESKSQHLGYFACPNEAYRAYVAAKEIYVKEVANKYRDNIDPRIYEILMTWTVEDQSN